MTIKVVIPSTFYKSLIWGYPLFNNSHQFLVLHRNEYPFHDLSPELSPLNPGPSSLPRATTFSSAQVCFCPRELLYKVSNILHVFKFTMFSSLYSFAHDISSLCNISPLLLYLEKFSSSLKTSLRYHPLKFSLTPEPQIFFLIVTCTMILYNIYHMVKKLLCIFQSLTVSSLWVSWE